MYRTRSWASRRRSRIPQRAAGSGVRHPKWPVVASSIAQASSPYRYRHSDRSLPCGELRGKAPGRVG